MATMNISLPDAMKLWVESQTETGSYSNTSDFVRDLIRQDQHRRSQIAAMQDLVNEARVGGVSPLSMEDVRRMALERLAQPQAKNANGL